MFSWCKKCSTCRYRGFLHYFVIPQHIILGLILCLAFSIIYLMGHSVSLIPNDSLQHRVTYSNLSCPNLTSQVLLPNVSVAPSNESDHWTKFYESLFSSCDWWATMLTCIPSGYFSTQYGGRLFLVSTFLLISILHMLFPLALQATKGKYLYLFLLNTFLGVLGVAMNSAVITILSYWLPKHNRMLLVCLIYSTSRVLYIHANVFITNFTDSLNFLFYFWGSIGILCSFLLYFFCFSTPWDHPRISVKEKNFLQENLEECVFCGKKKVPWVDILLSGPVWAITIALLGNYWISSALTGKILEYLKIVLQLDINYKVKWLFLYAWVVTIFFGCFCDWLNNENYISITTIRKYSVLFPSAGCAVSILFTFFSACHRETAFLFYSMANCFYFVINCSITVNFLDFAPNFAGLVYAVVLTFYYLIITLNNIIINTFTSYNTYTDWNVTFWVAAAVSIITGYLYKVFASGDIQRWNYVKKM